MEKSQAPHHKNGTGPPKNSSSQSDDLQQNRDGMSPPPVGSPPHHTLYYPHPMGYPPNQGYAPYPNEYPPQAYSYGAPPPNYYAPQTHNPYPSSNNGRGFIRGFILCSCIMFTVFFVVTVIFAFAMHPSPPIYKVVSLSVDNFNTTTMLSCNWSTVVSVENPNSKLKSFLSEFKVALVYEGDEIGQGNTLGFELDTRQNKQIGLGSTVNGAIVDMSDMAKEREGGSVAFSMKMSSIAAFRSDSVTTRGEMVLALCDGLKVVFPNNSNSGAFTTGNNPILCKSYY